MQPQEAPLGGRRAAASGPGGQGLGCGVPVMSLMASLVPCSVIQCLPTLPATESPNLALSPALCRHHLRPIIVVLLSSPKSPHSSQSHHLKIGTGHTTSLLRRPHCPTPFPIILKIKSTLCLWPRGTCRTQPYSSPASSPLTYPLSLLSSLLVSGHLHRLFPLPSPGWFLLSLRVSAHMPPPQSDFPDPLS